MARPRRRRRALALLYLLVVASLCLDACYAKDAREEQPKGKSDVVESSYRPSTSATTTTAADVESDDGPRQQRPTTSSEAECTASTGRELLVALGTPSCSVILLTGVVSVYDADFVGIDKAARGAKVDADRGFARTMPVTIRSAEVGSSNSTAAAPVPRARRDSNGTSEATTPDSRVASDAAGAAPVARAALETATRLTFHVDVPSGVVVKLEGLSLAGISRAPPAARASHRNGSAAPTADAVAAAAAGVDRAGSRGGGAMFSVFHVHDGGTVSITRCDLRAKRGACASSSPPSSAAVVGGSVDGSLLTSADPGGKFRRIEHGDILIESATVHPLALFGVEAAALGASNANASASTVPRRLFSASPPSPPSSPPAPRLVVEDTVLWCPETGFVRAGRPSAPGEGRASVSSRVSTQLELSSALGSSGSRTVLCEDDLVLPRAGHGRPAALVQDRDVVFRAAPDDETPEASDGGRPTKRPIRLSCLHEPGAKDCVFPVVAAGPGGSVSFEGLSIEAPDPGCAVQPATRCSYRGRELPRSLRGTLLPAGAAGIAGGGWLVFSGVDISYDYCTEGFESAVRAIRDGSAGTGDGISLTVLDDARNGTSGDKVSFSCSRCDFDCFVPGGDERGELPGMVSMRNVTIGCSRPLPASLKKRAGSGVSAVKGNGASGGGNGVGGTTTMTSPEQAASESSVASPPPSSSTRLSTAALAATLAAGGAAVAAAALGAALGARTVAKRSAAASAAAAAAAAGGASAAEAGARGGSDGRSGDGVDR